MCQRNANVAYTHACVVPDCIHVGESACPPVVGTRMSANPMETYVDPAIRFFESRKLKVCGTERVGELAAVVATTETTAALPNVVVMSGAGVQVMTAEHVPVTVVPAGTGLEVLVTKRP